jgi:hypothetical protein
VEDKAEVPAAAGAVEDKAEVPAAAGAVEDKAEVPAAAGAVEDKTEAPAVAGAVEDKTEAPAVAGAVEDKAEEPESLDLIPLALEDQALLDSLVAFVRVQVWCRALWRCAIGPEECVVVSSGRHAYSGRWTQPTSPQPFCPPSCCCTRSLPLCRPRAPTSDTRSVLTSSNIYIYIFIYYCVGIILSLNKASYSRMFLRSGS